MGQAVLSKVGGRTRFLAFSLGAILTSLPLDCILRGPPTCFHGSAVWGLNG